MERSLFVGPELSSSVSRDALVGKAAACILSALTPQVGPVVFRVCRSQSKCDQLLLLVTNGTFRLSCGILPVQS